MPVTKIDPSAALVVIDLQKGIAAIPAAHPVADIVSRTAELARAFRKCGLPVVLVNVTAAPPGRTDTGPRTFNTSGGWTDLLPELEQQPGDLLVSKGGQSALVGTALHEQLQERGITQIFITGIATGSGVESTARTARDLGYNVVLVTDAMTDRDAETHTWCVSRVFPRIAETDTTGNILKLLQQPAIP